MTTKDQVRDLKQENACAVTQTPVLTKAAMMTKLGLSVIRTRLIGATILSHHTRTKNIW